VGLPHFFAGAPQPGETVVLDTDDAHHALRSLRVRPGDRFTSSDGRGGLATCRVIRASGLLLEGEVEERVTERRPEPILRILLSPPKGDRLTWAVQKLVEVGADEIVLVEAARSVRRWKGDRATRAGERLAAVAREAAKQARRRFLPELRGPIEWGAALVEALEAGPVFVLWEGASDGLLGLLPREAPDRLVVVVGPEGGIPEEEAAAARDRGAVLASLGPNILRTETAAVAAASVALARYGRLG
jgi:16S rRNA (uracil1498-N3)-methyltransferase